MSESRRGFGLDVEFTDHFKTQLVTTHNYRAIADLYILQITTAHNYSQFVTRLFLITAPTMDIPLLPCSSHI
jgi:hypothetical protein